MPSRVDLPLIHKRTRKPIGALTIIRAQSWSFTDDQGRRRSTPVMTDQLLITLTDAKGEEIAYLEVPMEQLPADDH